MSRYTGGGSARVSQSGLEKAHTLALMSEGKSVRGSVRAMNVLSKSNSDNLILQQLGAHHGLEGATHSDYRSKDMSAIDDNISAFHQLIKEEEDTFTSRHQLTNAFLLSIEMRELKTVELFIEKFLSKRSFATDTSIPAALDALPKLLEWQPDLAHQLISIFLTDFE